MKRGGYIHALTAALHQESLHLTVFNVMLLIHSGEASTKLGLCARATLTERSIRSVLDERHSMLFQRIEGSSPQRYELTLEGQITLARILKKLPEKPARRKPADEEPARKKPDDEEPELPKAEQLAFDLTP